MIKEQVARLVCPYGVERRVLRGPARGLAFVVTRGMGVHYWLGTESAAPRLFGERVRAGATVWDIGANVGQFTLIFAAVVGRSGRVVAVEPAVAAVRCLERNLQLNRLEHVRVICAAAAEGAGQMRLDYDPQNPTEGRLLNAGVGAVRPGAEVSPVPTIALDSLLEVDGRPDLIKIDVEGAAARALCGARRVLDETRPVIYIELHGPEEQAAVRDELLTRGYRASTLDGRLVDDPVGAWHSPLWCVPHDRLP